MGKTKGGAEPHASRGGRWVGREENVPPGARAKEKGSQGPGAGGLTSPLRLAFGREVRSPASVRQTRESTEMLMISL